MKRNSVFAAVCGAAAAHRLLSVGTLLCAAASVLASLLPPLLLLLPAVPLPHHGLPYSLLPLLPEWLPHPVFRSLP